MASLEDFAVGYICADSAALTSCCVSLDERLPKTFHQGIWDDNCYTLGRVGPHHVVLCSSIDGNMAVGALQMMRTFTSLKLLILVSSKAGAVPGSSGQVRVGDVVVPPNVVMSGKSGDKVTRALYRGLGLLATTSTGRDTAQPQLLGDDIETLIAKNDRWGPKCKRPAGDDVDELNKIFSRRSQDVSLAHHGGVVISLSSYPENAEDRDSIVVPLNPSSIACFDHGETGGFLPRDFQNIDTVSVLGMSHYCDGNAEDAQRRWGRYASMAAAASARRIVLRLDNEKDNQELDDEESRE